jgi:hypothetical protein
MYFGRKTIVKLVEVLMINKEKQTIRNFGVKLYTEPVANAAVLSSQHR